MKKRYLQIKTIRGQTRHLVIKTKRLGGKRVQKSRELHAAPGTREYDMQYLPADKTGKGLSRCVPHGQTGNLS